MIMVSELDLSVRSIMQSHTGYGLCDYPRVSKHLSLYEVRLWAPYQTHNMEGQGALFCQTHHSELVWDGWPYQQLYCHHRNFCWCT